MSNDLILTDPLTAVANAPLDLGSDRGVHTGKDVLITVIYIPMPPDGDLAEMDDESGLEQLPPGVHTPMVKASANSNGSVVRISDPLNAPKHEKLTCTGKNEISIKAVSGVMSVTVYNGGKRKVEMTIDAPTGEPPLTLKYNDCFTHYEVSGHSDARHTTEGMIDGHPFKWG